MLRPYESMDVRDEFRVLVFTTVILMSFSLEVRHIGRHVLTHCFASQSLELSRGNILAPQQIVVLALWEPCEMNEASSKHAQ